MHGKSKYIIISLLILAILPQSFYPFNYPSLCSNWQTSSDRERMSSRIPKFLPCGKSHPSLEYLNGNKLHLFQKLYFCQGLSFLLQTRNVLLIRMIPFIHIGSDHTRMFPKRPKMGCSGARMSGFPPPHPAPALCACFWPSKWWPGPAMVRSGCRLLHSPSRRGWIGPQLV